MGPQGQFYLGPQVLPRLQLSPGSPSGLGMTAPSTASPGATLCPAGPLAPPSPLHIIPLLTSLGRKV